MTLLCLLRLHHVNDYGDDVHDDPYGRGGRVHHDHVYHDDPFCNCTYHIFHSPCCHCIYYTYQNGNHTFHSLYYNHIYRISWSSRTYRYLFRYPLGNHICRIS
ncbi:unnamed protein product [Trichobilharzia regenti]|nr:unnamed protein product [Trichobilharzia regenti]